MIGHCNMQSNKGRKLQLTMLLLAMSTHSVFEGVALGAQVTFFRINKKLCIF